MLLILSVITVLALVLYRIFIRVLEREDDANAVLMGG